MKKLFVYLLFYCLTAVSTILSGFIVLFFVGILSIRVVLLYNYHFSEDVVSVCLFLVALPLYIFFFQVLQDVNYRVIHLTGHWAYSVPKFSYRGMTIPNFYERKSQDRGVQTSIKKSKYRYRLFSIFQWVIATLVAELLIAGYWYVSTRFNLRFHGILFFVLFLGGLFLSFSFWDKLKQKLNLEIAYIENEREFYYKKGS